VLHDSVQAVGTRSHQLGAVPRARLRSAKDAASSPEPTEQLRACAVRTLEDTATTLLTEIEGLRAGAKPESGS
jgi:hypothetical protein